MKNRLENCHYNMINTHFILTPDSATPQLPLFRVPPLIPTSAVALPRVATPPLSVQGRDREKYYQPHQSRPSHFGTSLRLHLPLVILFPGVPALRNRHARAPGTIATVGNPTRSPHLPSPSRSGWTTPPSAGSAGSPSMRFQLLLGAPDPCKRV